MKSEKLMIRDVFVVVWMNGGIGDGTAVFFRYDDAMAYACDKIGEDLVIDGAVRVARVAIVEL